MPMGCVGGFLSESGKIGRYALQKREQCVPVGNVGRALFAVRFRRSCLNSANLDASMVAQELLMVSRS